MNELMNELMIECFVRMISESYPLNLYAKGFSKGVFTGEI